MSVKQGKGNMGFNGSGDANVSVDGDRIIVSLPISPYKKPNGPDNKATMPMIASTHGWSTAGGLTYNGKAVRYSVNIGNPAE
jgi:hypothetical protein